MRLSAWVSLFFPLTLFPFAAAHADPISKNYADVQAYIANIAKLHPDTTQLINVGPSDSGQTIQGLKIGNGAVHTLVVSTHHGNEYGATELAKAFATDVAANPIQGQTVYVIPVLNIGGYNARNREEMAQGKSWDPNRNYPGPCGTEGPFTLKDTKALADLVDHENIVTSATLHTFGPMVLYPWGVSASGNDLKTEYNDLFIQIGQAAVVESHYAVGNSTEMLYAADGAYEDYAFYQHGIWSMLFEIGTTHNPSQSQVDQMNKVNVPGLRRMMLTAPAQRAEKHAFTGKCDTAKRVFDRHDE